MTKAAEQAADELRFEGLFETDNVQFATRIIDNASGLPEVLTALKAAREKIAGMQILEMGVGMKPMFPVLLGQIDTALKKAGEYAE